MICSGIVSRTGHVTLNGVEFPFNISERVGEKVEVYVDWRNKCIIDVVKELSYDYFDYIDEYNFNPEWLL